VSHCVLVVLSPQIFLCGSDTRYIWPLSYFQSMFASFMMGDYDAMKQYAKKYFEFTISSWWFIMSNHIAHTFYGGLVCFLIFRESGDPIWEERARKFQSKIKTW
jgi:membrane-anchored glycerophosphoryl diester phosphodiesterase (GDPDase)